MNLSTMRTNWYGRLARFLGSANARPSRGLRTRARMSLEVLETRETPTVLPAGFEETLVVSGLNTPTAQVLTPDGRLFITEKGSVPGGTPGGVANGKVRVLKNGSLLSAPFLQVAVDNFSERGLGGIVLDPNFTQNGYVYVYYTKADPANPNTAGNAAANRLSRFTVSGANPDVADPNSELVILDNLAAPNGYHNGGSLQFGADGKLYVGIGEGGFSTLSQDLTSYYGKILRLNVSNLSNLAPTDNPYYDPSDGISIKDYVWAYGYRNPFTSAVLPGTNTIYVNDVGGTAWEEVNSVTRGQNYGWPNAEGPTTNPAYASPLYAYNHNGSGAAVTGGAFYTATQFPTTYQGSYFFGDYVQGTIRVLNPANPSAATVFATGGAYPVDLDLAPDGGLYYLSIGMGSVYKISYVGIPDRAPMAVATATPTSGQGPLTVAFDGTGSTDPDGDPLTYSWDFGDGTGGTGATTSHTYASNGSYTARLTVNDRPNGSGLSNTSAPITITVGNTAPTPTILTPTFTTLYAAGDTITFSGTAMDPEDGALPASAFHWSVIFGHNTHTHPFIGAIDGVTSGSFQIPTTGETDADVYYRILLTVTDSGGLQTTTYTDIRPRVSTITLATNIPGLILYRDGQPVTAPGSVSGVVGSIRTISAPQLQSLYGVNYQFVSWSDGGAATHTIATQSSNTTYTATYVPVPIAVAVPSTTTGLFPLTVSFSSLGSQDPGGQPLNYTWDFGDGTSATGATVTRTYSKPGVYAARLTVTNTAGQSNTTAPMIISPTATTYLSDLSWKSAMNGYGPVEKDKSNGENGAGDGRTITLNGTTYAKGLGVHSPSEIHYTLGGAYATFMTDIGIDDEVLGNLGSVVFQVWTDGVKIYDSGIMTGASPTKSIVLDVTGRNDLALIVTDAGDSSNNDHADWANARLIAPSATYLSNLNWTSQSNGYGPAEKDTSNGENGTGDGRTITLNGTTYAKGLGMHSDAEVRYALNGIYSRFVSDIGVDDEVGNDGSVVFQVWADETLLYDSGLMRGSSATKTIDVPVSGRNELVLKLLNGGDFYSNDHGDWANARLVINPPVFVSDLTWTSAVNGYGPVEKDTSNGESVAGDGRTITLNGTTYTKGLGTHSYSEVHYALNGAYSRFMSDVGVDDYVGPSGSVVFQVWADGVKLYDSGIMTGSSSTQRVSVDVTGRNDLALIVTNGGDNSNADHADWAGALLILDTTPPTVTAVSPASGSAAMPLTTLASAAFSEPIDPTTLNSSTFTLVKQGTSVSVPAAISYNAATRTATLTPLSALEGNATYVATLAGGFQGVKDRAGNTLAASYTWTFSTPDTLPPTVASVSPANNLTGVVRSEVVRATFSEAVDPLTVNTATLTLTGPGGIVPAAVTYNAATRTATLKAGVILQPYTSYTLTIKGGTTGVKDTSGNAMAADFVSTFVTGTAVYLSDLTWTSATNGYGPVEKDMSNGDGAAGDGGTITLEGVSYAKGLGTHAASEIHYALNGNYARFVSDIGVDDYVGPAGSVVFQVWADGVKLFDSGVMTGSSATQRVSVDITGRNDLGLIVTNAGDGVAADHADWAGAMLVGDTTPPTVTGFSPNNGATAVAVASAITANFSEPMNAATLTASNVFLVKQGTTTPISATRTYNATTRTITLQPTTNLSSASTYVVTLKGGPGGITDLIGNPLASDLVWSFTTAASSAAIIGAPSSSPEGTTLSLTSTVTSPNGPLTYAWSVAKNGGAFASATTTAFAFTPDDNGTYIVTLTVTDRDGIPATDQKTIVITNVAPSVAIAGAPATSAEGTTINLTGLVTDPGLADTFTHLWSVTRNGSPYGATGTAAGYSFTPNDNGTFVVTLQVADKDGGVGTATRTITVANVAPVASITGGPVGSIPEGSPVSLGSTASDPSTADVTAGLNYLWSVTRNGSPYGATGTAAGYSFTPNDNGTFVVTLQVTDKDGGVGTVTRTITVTNVAPTTVGIGPTDSVRGQVRTFTLTAADPSSVDASALIFTINWGDGTPLQTVSGPSGTNVTKVYAQAGSYTVTITVADKDGGSLTRTFPITVTAAGILPDPDGSGKTALIVGGTTAADTITLTPASTTGDVSVVVNGAAIGTFRFTGRIIVYAQGGDDVVRLLSTTIGGTGATIISPYVIFGGDGNDTLNASGASSNGILIGGNGNDTITGGSGRDIIIGGAGVDTLFGGGNDDILIGGTTNYDADLTALTFLMNEWARTDADFTTRRNHLTGVSPGGFNGVYQLTLATVRDDAAVDDLWGEAGLDWFFVRTTGSNKDRQRDPADAITQV